MKEKIGKKEKNRGGWKRKCQISRSGRKFYGVVPSQSHFMTPSSNDIMGERWYDETTVYVLCMRISLTKATEQRTRKSCRERFKFKFSPIDPSTGVHFQTSALPMPLIYSHMHNIQVLSKKIPR